MTHPALIERITRSLAYMLRHQPDQFDLELDRYGNADLTEVVQALNERLDEPIEVEDIEDAVEAGASTRYEIAGEKIRALYGHSIDVEAGEAAKPQEYLYVGLPVRDAERAMKTGLRSGRRRYLHLALSADDAAETGRRLARSYTLVRVHALDAWEEGINFYDRKSLFLSETIPTSFLEMGETRDDGEGPPQRRQGGGDGARGGRGRRPRRDDERSSESRDSDRGRGRGRGRDDSPREEQPSREEPARAERSSNRDERPARRERPERGGREEQSREPEVARREVPRPAPAKKESPADAFGVGVFGEPAKEERKAAPKAPRREEPKPAKTEAPRKPVESDGPGFGAGV